MGCTNIDIAEICHCSTSTLTRHFEQHLIKGRAELRRSLRQTQIDKALGGNVVMLIWLGKQYLGQSDKQEHTVSDELYEIIIGRAKAQNTDTNPES